MAEQFLEASYLGFGTKKYSGTPNDVTLKTLCGGAIDGDVSGFDIYVISAAATLYFENDGSTADADTMPVEVPGLMARGRNQKSAFDRFRFFSTGACEIRIMLWG